MKKETLTISLVQADLHWEKVDANLAMFSEMLKGITDGESDLILLPEMFNTGFTMQAQAFAEDANGKTIAWMRTQAKLKKAHICGSIIFKEKEKFFNRLIWMKPGGRYETYDKRHLFRFAGEHEHFAGGKKKLITVLNGWKICPLVCYDLRFPVWSRNSAVKKLKSSFDFDLLIYIANWPERRSHAWKTLLRARAIENQVFTIGVNRVGPDGNGIQHSGDSAFIDPMGETVHAPEAGAATVSTCTITKEKLNDWRKRFPAWMDADSFAIKR